MDSQSPSLALHKHVEVATRLCCLNHTKARRVARNRQIVADVGGDLQEYTAVRAALISLAGRVQKTRTEPDAGCDAVPVAQDAPQPLQVLAMLLVAGDVSQNRRKISGMQPREMRLQPALDRAIGIRLT